LGHGNRCVLLFLHEYASGGVYAMMENKKEQLINVGKLTLSFLAHSEVAVIVSKVARTRPLLGFVIAATPVIAKMALGFIEAHRERVLLEDK